MKKLKAISRWVTIQSKAVTNKSALYKYGGDDCEDGKRYVMYFRYKNCEYALNRFLSRYGICGFDKNCIEYPAFITGYDGDMIFNSTLCSIDEYGEKIRLYTEIR